jgi:hypothetical protein
MLDILNEEDHHARRARLFEDFLEKTDLRVSYPELVRKHGARVQVTSIIEPEQHKTKRQAIKLAEEFVFLSPLSLAEFVNSLRGHTPVAWTSDTLPFALTTLWGCLGVKPLDVPQLACELKRIMFGAMTGMPNSPLGPMVRVPLPIRQLIRLFVETHAMACTSRLRKREGAHSRNFAADWNGSDDDCGPSEKRAVFLRALSPGDRIWGRVCNIVDYGAFVDVGSVEGLLHVSVIPGAVKGMIGEKMSKGEEIEVEVLKIDVEQQRLSFRVPTDSVDGK